MAYGECIITGCSSQICAEEPTSTDCSYLDWYTCFQYSECGNYGLEGNCSWLTTDSFLDCLNLFGVTVGCTNSEACNYDETANVDDGSCEYYDECEGCCYEEFLANENCDGGGGCFIPQCTENCEWEPMQCWGATGYCWCVDEDGIEIEGTSQPSWEGSPNCEEIDLGDINGDSFINVQDIVLLISFVLQIDFPTDTEFMAADYNGDGILNILDVVSIVDLILNPQVSIQINSGTSYGECWGYCVFELALDNSSALFTASSWGSWYDEFLDLLLEDNLSQEAWQQLVGLIDFEYFQSLDDVYGCPDCADGGAEFIKIIYDGVAKQVIFDAYTEIDGIQELTILLRDLRAEYWNQINGNQECYIIPEVGPCDGICPTYYFNQNTNQCEEFIFGCCGPEAFDTMQGCIDSCE
jgi:eight-cysteine-cluster-containing protein